MNTANESRRIFCALRADGVTHRYGKQTVLDDLSLVVEAGAVLGLLGRNGAGKSTLLRCIVGLTVPTLGECELLGCPSRDLDDSARERLGYVAQQPELFDWLTVREHLHDVGSCYRSWSHEAALAVAQRLGLEPSKRVGTLSVGDRQKLAVVLALGHDPDVLILDEPVASLDPIARREFMRLIFDEAHRASRDQGRRAPRTVLLSSHLLSDLERVVSHVAFLDRGRIAHHGAWDELQERTGRSLEDLFVGWGARRVDAETGVAS